MKTKLTNITFGLLFLGSGLLVTSLLTSCTVNVKHSNTGIKQETKKETQEYQKTANPVAQKTQEPKNFESTTQSPQTAGWVVYRAVVIEKDTPKVEVFKKRESDDANRDIISDVKSINQKLDKLDITNRLLSEINKKIEMKVAKGLL